MFKQVGNWQVELLKWLYVSIVSSVMFLFFCLFLDLFCYLLSGGWQPLLGDWPIFSGTISLVLYGKVWKVLILLIGLSGTARIMLGTRIPPFFPVAVAGPGNGEADLSEPSEQE